MPGRTEETSKCTVHIYSDACARVETRRRRGEDGNTGHARIRVFTMCPSMFHRPPHRTLHTSCSKQPDQASFLHEVC